MKTILVTGGCGFIGSNFIRYTLAAESGMRIVNFDALTYAGNLENLKGVLDGQRLIFVRGDIRDKTAVSGLFNKYDFDCVINFAAESHVDRSFADPELFCQTNVGGVVNLLNAAKEFWREGKGFKAGKRFLQISTDEVYGSLGKEGSFSENSPLDPHSPYSAGKASADLFVKAYFDTYGLPCLITRCSNNFGPRQFPEKLIPLVFNNACALRPVPIYGDGLQVRDWLYVSDHCAAIEAVLAKGGLGQVYNIGGHNEKTNLEIVRAVIGYVGQNINPKAGDNLITHVADRPGHDRRCAVDSAKIQSELGWRPQTTFEKGLAATLDWYKNNPEWLKNATSGKYKAYYEKMYLNR